MTTNERIENEVSEAAVQTTNAQEASEAPRVWASAPVDILEGDEAYLIVADMPGVDASGLSIRYQEGELKLEAVRSVDPSTGWPTHFRRVISVGVDVDVERISAELDHGVLQVTLPKRETAKPRTIEIKIG